jgi:RNA polymerase sigma-70 factor (ECF subfamily)
VLRAGHSTNPNGGLGLLQTDTFAELIQRVRDGEEQAATELVRACEPHIHRAIRYPLRYYGLDRVLECTDISQSVLAAFFRRRLVFRFPLQHPSQLVRLLVRMARQAVVDEVRKHQATCRDRRRLEPHHSELLEEIPQRDATPSKIAAANELLREMYRRLPDEERTLAQLRANGMEWTEIAELQGGNPELLRKRLARAVLRVGHQMGLGPIAIA